MSSDSEVEDILLRTPTLQKLRTLDRLSTDALDPETLQAAAAASVMSSSGQMRQSRPRDRQHRRSFSPLLDSTERDHYSVSSQLLSFGPSNGSPMATNVVVLLRVGTYQIFNSLQLLFISQPNPIVIKLYIRIGDNILHNHTVSNLQLKS